MDNNLRDASTAAEPFDYKQYERVWQRVAPSLNPYPGAVPAAGPAPFGAQPAAQPAKQPAQSAVPPAVQPAAQPEENPPGSVEHPCCMGLESKEQLEALADFIEDELADRRYYLTMMRSAPLWARQTLRELSLEEGAHARRLMAVYYLITGRCYQPSMSCERIYIGAWCPALRERYHAEACGGLAYMRASEQTVDPCLARLLKELSEDEYRHSEELTYLLERSVAGACGQRETGV
jgi:rubrerythrin